MFRGRLTDSVLSLNHCEHSEWLPSVQVSVTSLLLAAQRENPESVKRHRAHAAMAEPQVQLSPGTFFGRPSPSVVSPGGGQSKAMMETCCVTDVFLLEQLAESQCPL